MAKKRILTGITTTGTPHLGNYVGAIRPAIAASKTSDYESYFFLADYHALIKCQEPELIRQSTLEIAATWLALGLDPNQVFFYRQSDIPEVAELTWLLSCVTAKGLLNRAHAYKAATDANQLQQADADAGITAGLYLYPVLMAADILLFNAHEVPVGKDQIQHIEMARDIAQRFNHVYQGDYFVLPEAKTEASVAVLPGLDGRKMSKSYGNIIPLWLTEKEMEKTINGIVTNSLEPGQPKDPDSSHLFLIYQAFASAEQGRNMAEALRGGLGWGEAKRKLHLLIKQQIASARDAYQALIAKPADIEDILHQGKDKARPKARELLARLREGVGLRTLSAQSAKVVTAKSPDRNETNAQVRWLTYREKDGKFYCKLVDAKNRTLLLSGACKDSGEIKAVQQECLLSASQLQSLSRIEQTAQGWQYTIDLPLMPLFGMHFASRSECEATFGHLQMVLQHFLTENPFKQGE